MEASSVRMSEGWDATWPEPPVPGPPSDIAGRAFPSLQLLATVHTMNVYFRPMRVTWQDGECAGCASEA